MLYNVGQDLNTSETFRASLGCHLDVRDAVAMSKEMRAVLLQDFGTATAKLTARQRTFYPTPPLLEGELFFRLPQHPVTRPY